MKTCFSILLFLCFISASSQAPLPHYEFHPSYSSAYHRALRHPNGNFYTFGTALLGNYVNWPVSHVRVAVFDSAGNHLLHQSAPAFNFEHGILTEVITGFDGWLNCTGNTNLCDVMSEEGFLIQMSPDGMTFRTQSISSGFGGILPVLDIIQRPDSHLQLASQDKILVLSQTGDSLYQIPFPHGRIEEILPWGDRMIVFANQTYITDTGYQILDSFPNCPQAHRSEWLDAGHFVVYREPAFSSNPATIYVLDTNGMQTGFRVLNPGEAWCIDSGKVLICDPSNRNWYDHSLNLLSGNTYPPPASFLAEAVAAGPDKIMIAGTSGPMNEGCVIQWRNGGSISSSDDVDILSVRIDSVVVYPYSNWPGSCDLRLNVHVKIKNAGTTVLNSFGVKCQTVGGGMCGPLYWDAWHSGMNLAPGDSVEVLLGRITDILLYRPTLHQYMLHVYAGAANDHGSQDATFDYDSAGFDTNLMIVGINKEEKTELQIFPNPAREVVFVETGFSGGEAIQLELFNSAGEIIKTENWVKPEGSIPLEGLPQGIYLLRISTEKESWIRKILKE